MPCDRGKLAQRLQENLHSKFVSQKVGLHLSVGSLGLIARPVPYRYKPWLSDGCNRCNLVGYNLPDVTLWGDSIKIEITFFPVDGFNTDSKL